MRKRRKQFHQCICFPWMPIVILCMVILPLMENWPKFPSVFYERVIFSSKRILDPIYKDIW